MPKGSFHIGNGVVVNLTELPSNRAVKADKVIRYGEQLLVLTKSGEVVVGNVRVSKGVWAFGPNTRASWTYPVIECLHKLGLATAAQVEEARLARDREFEQRDRESALEYVTESLARYGLKPTKRQIEGIKKGRKVKPC